MERARVIRELGITWSGRAGHLSCPRLLGLRALYEDAKPTWVLPGRAQNIVRMLVLDARAKPRGFHDVTLVDMTNVSGPAVSTADMSHQRRQWPTYMLKRDETMTDRSGVAAAGMQALIS